MNINWLLLALVLELIRSQIMYLKSFSFDDNASTICTFCQLQQDASVINLILELFLSLYFPMVYNQKEFRDRSWHMREIFDDLFN